MKMKVKRVAFFSCPQCGAGVNTGKAPPLSPISCPGCKTALHAPIRLDHLLLMRHGATTDAGHVFMAQDSKLGRPISVMVLNDVEGDQSESVEAQLRLTRKLAALDHPCILNIHAEYSTETAHYIVTETASPCAADLLRTEHEFSSQELLSILKRAAQGLCAAAEQGILHGALSPAHLLLRAEQAVRVAGFQPSVYADSPPQGNWANLGHHGFIAPEVKEGQRPDVRSDIWSLGKCIGKLQNKTKNDDTKLPEPLRAILNQMIARDPRQRPENWDDVLTQLQAMGSPAVSPTEEETISLSDVLTHSSSKEQDWSQESQSFQAPFAGGEHAVDDSEDETTYETSGFLEGLAEADSILDPTALMGSVFGDEDDGAEYLQPDDNNSPDLIPDEADFGDDDDEDDLAHDPLGWLAPDPSEDVTPDEPTTIIEPEPTEAAASPAQSEDAGAEKGLGIGALNPNMMARLKAKNTGQPVPAATPKPKPKASPQPAPQPAAATASSGSEDAGKPTLGIGGLNPDMMAKLKGKKPAAPATDTTGATPTPAEPESPTADAGKPKLGIGGLNPDMMAKLKGKKPAASTDNEASATPETPVADAGQPKLGIGGLNPDMMAKLKGKKPAASTDNETSATPAPAAPEAPAADAGKPTLGIGGLNPDMMAKLKGKKPAASTDNEASATPAPAAPEAPVADEGKPKLGIGGLNPDMMAKLKGKKPAASTDNDTSAPPAPAAPEAPAADEGKPKLGIGGLNPDMMAKLKSRQ